MHVSMANMVARMHACGHSGQQSYAWSPVGEVHAAGHGVPEPLCNIQGEGGEDFIMAAQIHTAA